MMKPTESKEELLGSRNNIGKSSTSLEGLQEEYSLTQIEKRFLLLAERGDCASVKRLLEEYKNSPEVLNLNCVDPLNRSALIAAIENENVELINILLDHNIKVKDALLHAIKEEYVEAVEILLEWEEKIHQPGEPYSWEAVDRSSSNFTPDITPLILAAHMNNYEILKILLDRGATLPMPHDVRCGCDDCVVSSEQDSLRHSQSRINAYRALTSSSLIALSARDPLLTAFELSWELRRLSKMETEFRAEYLEMKTSVQTFSTTLLDHVRTSNELEVMLNHNPTGETWEPGERQTLERLKLAIKYKQKMFVAHPNVQQLLAAIWYDGLPGFRRKSMPLQLVEVAKLGCMFPVYSSIYMMSPNSKMAGFMKKPFVKFIIHSASYAFFLSLLGAASQRLEYLLIEWFGPDWLQEILFEWKRKERGSFPGLVESCVILYVMANIWNEMRSLWTNGILEYLGDLWNIVDFITNTFYTLWITLRFTSIFIVYREHSNGIDPWYPREEWDQFDPMLLSEGAFAAGMIFSFMKLVHIFSVNPHLGPLQISLGRMIIDIIKFLIIYTLVLFAFGCGLNQLLWYYSDLERHKCYHLPSGLPDFDNQDRACTVWRRFTNLFEASQSLFWASFGLVDLVTFEMTGIKEFTRFWALLMFGSYSVINIIVLLNMLIAMMSSSYQIISERSDTEWKFARTRLWMSYFEEGDTLPPPFNLMPTMKNITRMMGCGSSNRKTGSMMKKSQAKAQERHTTIMRMLIKRYVVSEQRKRFNFGITEDDVIEIRQDISTLRYELIDILRTNGMKCPQGSKADLCGKKGRVMERRLMNDFHIGIVEGIVNEAIKSDKGPKDIFGKIAKAIGKKAPGGSGKKGKDWNAMVRHSQMIKDPIGSTTEARNRQSRRQSARRHIIDHQNDAMNMDPERIIDYNPKLKEFTPATRVAYAKFKIKKIQQEYENKEDGDGTGSISQQPTTSEGDPATVTTTNEKSAATTSSIVRPRPRSSTSQKSQPSTSSMKDPGPQIPFRPKTPIEEDPREGATTPDPKKTSPGKEVPAPDPKKPAPGKEVTEPKVTSAASTEVKSELKPSTTSSTKAPTPPPRSPAPGASPTPGTSTPGTSSSTASQKKEEVKKTEEGCKPEDEKKKEGDKKDDKDDEGKRPPVTGITKATGKSKITGQVMSGWI
uniref:Transient receptor potential n=1 Tax=Nilaparvata lugens TaxID=108931 RepID=A0A384THF3_NILLU|nr:transient receptor potential [Nilaparvata lugens]